MEIFVQLLDELDDVIGALALARYRLGRWALCLGLEISLAALVVRPMTDNVAWLMLLIGAASLCVAFWTVTSFVQRIAEGRQQAMA